MIKFAIFSIIIGILGFSYYSFFYNKGGIPAKQVRISEKNNKQIPNISIIAQNLDTPWGMAFLPNGDILLTERPGRVRLIQNDNNKSTLLATIEDVVEMGEGGLLGIAVHPNFSTNNWIYLYYTYRNTDSNTLNRVVRMELYNSALHNEKIIVDAIPGAANHNGGRLQFGPDNLLYITTGDAQEPSQAQNTSSLAGKILRVTENGEPASGNPFNNRIYSFGHRNPQGLTWDNAGNLWATEHGRSGITSGLDEINLIKSGKNYGWPDIQGDETKTGMENPETHSGAMTWAPSGAAYINSSIFFGGLRGSTLYKATLHKENITEIKEYFKNDYGRIREVAVGTDRMIYFSTSNRDGRGIPSSTDDRIIRINPQFLN